MVFSKVPAIKNKGSVTFESIGRKYYHISSNLCSVQILQPFLSDFLLKIRKRCELELSDPVPFLSEVKIGKTVIPFPNELSLAKIKPNLTTGAKHREKVRTLGVK